VVGLVLRDLEELQGVAEVIPFEPFSPKDGIRESDGNRRVVGAYENPLGRRLVFDFVESGQAAGGLPFQKFDPAVETLLAGEASGGLVGFHVGYATELI